MLRRLSAPLGAVSALFLLAACASSNPVDPNDRTRSVVYGYIDMEDASSSLGWVYIKDYSAEDRGFRAAVDDGVFYHLGIPPGPYQVDSFGRSATWWSNTNYTYEFGGQGRNQTAVRIKRPGLYFVGAYKYVAVSTGWLEQGKFEMKKVKRPSEREILAKVLAHMEDVNPEYVRQIAMVRRRLAQLAGSQ
jgi:hypothetical protein